MKVVIYRNKVDSNIRKISRFTSELKEKLEDTGLDIEIVCGGKRNVPEVKSRVLEAISTANTIIVFSHGKEDAIYLHLASRMDQGEGIILIDKSNASVLENKKVIVFACDTAKELGPYVTNDDVQCRSYVGFNDSINLGLYNDKHNTPQTTGFFYRLYSAVFEEVLVATMNQDLSANNLQKRFRRKMSSAIHEYNSTYGIEEPTFDKRLLSDINTVLEKTSKSMRIFGNIHIGLIS